MSGSDIFSVIVKADVQILTVSVFVFLDASAQCSLCKTIHFTVFAVCTICSIRFSEFSTVLQLLFVRHAYQE